VCGRAGEKTESFSLWKKRSGLGGVCEEEEPHHYVRVSEGEGERSTGSNKRRLGGVGTYNIIWERGKDSSADCPSQEKVVKTGLRF